MRFLKFCFLQQLLLSEIFDMNILFAISFDLQCLTYILRKLSFHSLSTYDIKHDILL